MLLWTYVGSLLVLALGLPIFSYLTLIYRELGRMTTGRVHEHLEIFEAEIEPKLNIHRRSGGRTFRILGHFWLAFVVLETTRGVVYLVPNRWEAGVQFLVFLSLEVVILMHFVPDMLLYRTTGRWLLPLLPLVRAGMWLVWPIRIFLEGAESLARISEQEVERTEEQRTEEGIEALVEVAEEEGIIEPEQADLIEQVVEFSDKRVREVMTPRPDVVSIQADASLEEMHAKYVETNLAKMPVYERSPDDIVGVVHAQDLLQVADADLPKRKVRELMKAILFVPETKVGSLPTFAGNAAEGAVDGGGDRRTRIGGGHCDCGRSGGRNCRKRGGAAYNQRRVLCEKRMVPWSCAAACPFRTLKNYRRCSLASIPTRLSPLWRD